MRPNILLIMADQFVWNGVGEVGGWTYTPNLDRLYITGRLIYVRKKGWYGVWDLTISMKYPAPEPMERKSLSIMSIWQTKDSWIFITRI